MPKPLEPLRGEAAFKAAKQDVAERNEKAFARGRKERAARQSAWVARRHTEEREASSHLPHQPGR